MDVRVCFIFEFIRCMLICMGKYWVWIIVYVIWKVFYENSMFVICVKCIIIWWIGNIINIDFIDIFNCFILYNDDM